MYYVLPKVGFVFLMATTVLFLFSAAANSTSETHDGLKQLLQRYPGADLNQDGVLTMEEAKGFRTRLWQQETDAGTPIDRTAPEEGVSVPTVPGDPLLSNIAYGALPGQYFDLWLPRDATLPCPAVICIVSEPETTAPPADLLKKCLESGIAVGMLHKSAGCADAACFEEVAEGLRFLFDNAHAHGVKRDRMALFGQGAVAEQVLYGALLPLGEGEQAGGIHCAAVIDAPAWNGTEEVPDPDVYVESAFPKLSGLLAEAHGAPAIALLYTDPNAGDLVMQALRSKNIEVMLNNAAENDGVPHLVRQAILFFRKQLGGDVKKVAPGAAIEKEEQ